MNPRGCKNFPGQKKLDSRLSGNDLRQYLRTFFPFIPDHIPVGSCSTLFIREDVIDLKYYPAIWQSMGPSHTDSDSQLNQVNFQTTIDHHQPWYSTYFGMPRKSSAWDQMFVLQPLAQNLLVQAEGQNRTLEGGGSENALPAAKS